MDQKHAMLYPDPAAAVASEQRSSAAAAIGLPVDPPPTYDIATRDSSTPTVPLGWTPQTMDTNYPTSSHYIPQINHQHLPVIVEQPNFPLPITEQPQPQPQLQQTDGMPITTQPTSELSSKLGPNPSTVICPSCGAFKTTRMSFTPNTRTHLCALILCLVGWCCCACIVPYCMNSCRTGNHYCSQCNAFLGTYNPNPNPKSHSRPQLRLPLRPHRRHRRRGQENES